MLSDIQNLLKIPRTPHQSGLLQMGCYTPEYLITGDMTTYSIIRGVAKRKAEVSKERQINTYAEVWHASYVMLEKAKKDPEGSYYQLMASLVFTAFTLEAFLNHIGQSIFKCWDDLEQLSPLRKLNLIAETLEIRKDEGKRPFQTISKLLRFRNDVAHGKTVHLKSTDQITVVDSEFDQHMRDSLQTPWQNYCNLENAERAREDVEEVCHIIHRASGLTGDILFSFGLQVSSATLLPED